MREDGGPHRRRGTEDGDEAARYELLRPEDDRPGPADVDEPDDHCDGHRSPAAREGLAEHDRDDGEQGGDHERPRKRQYEGGNVIHADLDRGPGRSPDQRDADVRRGDSKRWHTGPMMAHMVASMRCIVRYVWVAALVLGACAPAPLAGTDLGATDAAAFTLLD